MPRIFRYEAEPYWSELEVEILASGSDEKGPFAIVDDSILYPGGGGQPADTGALDGVPVLSSEPVPEGMRLGLAAPVAGSRARLDLDWAPRYDHMQQHTAQHLLTAVAQDRFGWATTSFHMEGDVCDIELETASLSPEELERLETAAMEVVRAAHPVRACRVAPEEYERMDVRSRGLPEGFAGDIRLVEIEGVDRTTCGGTHLASTSEIESIVLLGTESMRGGTRLRWVAGGRVRSRLRTHERRLHTLRTVLGVADHELADAIEARLLAAKTEARRSRHLQGLLAQETAARLRSESDALLETHVDGVGMAFLQQAAKALLAEQGDRLALLTATDDGESFFVVVGQGMFESRVGELGARVAEALGGRGGGAGPMFQGKVPSLANRGAAVRALDEALEAAS